MTGKRRIRVISLVAVLVCIAVLGWTAQAYLDLLRLESAVIDSCARVESASRIRLELVENLLLGAGPVLGEEGTARLGQAADRVREVHISPETLDDADNYRAFQRAQTDLSEALGAVWEASTPPPRPRLTGSALTDLRPEVELWSAALERGLAEMERDLRSYRSSVEAFPGSWLAAAVHREISPAVATQALAGGEAAPGASAGALR